MDGDVLLPRDGPHDTRERDALLEAQGPDEPEVPADLPVAAGPIFGVPAPGSVQPAFTATMSLPVLIPPTQNFSTVDPHLLPPVVEEAEETTTANPPEPDLPAVPTP